MPGVANDCKMPQVAPVVLFAYLFAYLFTSKTFVTILVDRSDSFLVSVVTPLVVLY